MEIDQGIRRLDGEEKRVALPAIAAFLIAILAAVGVPGTPGAPAPAGRPAAPETISVIPVAELAPLQPFTAFYGERSALVHRNGTTYFAYTDRHFNVFMKTFDHRTGTLSSPAFVAPGWNDHINPSVLIDREGYLHIFFGARPDAVHYLRSRIPLDWTGWRGIYIEEVGRSATYPVPIIIGDRIFLVFREGDSYGAELFLAVRDRTAPVSMPGAWRLRRITKKSSMFIPMPLGAFLMDGRACFIFDMRDALISYPITGVSPSIREGLAVICTRDGNSFTDLDGNPVGIPLDYDGDRRAFPVVLGDGDCTAVRDLSGTQATARFGDLALDGSFIEFTVRTANYTEAAITFGDDASVYGTVRLTPDGYLTMSNGPSVDTTGTYEPMAERSVRLKLYCSQRCYRAWVDGALAGPPLALTNPPGGEAVPVVVNCVDLSSTEAIESSVRTGREYKLITASACIDSAGEPHIFFIDRRDSSGGSYWALMHRHGGVVREIGDPSYSKYHPSSIAMGGHLYVAVAYFEGEGLYYQSNHLCESSRIMLLRTGDGTHWDGSRISGDDGGRVHPILKRVTESGPLEVIWTSMVNEATTYLTYGYAGDIDTLIPGAMEPTARLWNFPNPFNAATTIVIDLPGPAIVSLAIYDANGALVKRLLESEYVGGDPLAIVWSGDGDDNNPVASGIYFSHLTSSGVDCTRKLVLLR